MLLRDCWLEEGSEPGGISIKRRNDGVFRCLTLKKKTSLFVQSIVIDLKHVKKKRTTVTRVSDGSREKEKLC